MSTAQVESALVEHKNVAEAAVVACPHPVKGQALYCFITPKDGITIDSQMTKELKELVRKNIGTFASPDFIQVGWCMIR
jgi:acetyl-CoA synthetase